MRTPAAALALLGLAAAGCLGGPAHVLVRFDTSLGSFTVETLPEHAPRTVANFLQYVDDGFYDGLTFHRVAPGFVVQGGGFEADYATRHKERAPIPLEASAEQPNVKWTVAMARQGPDTATSEFFVNLADNTGKEPGVVNLDPTGPGTGFAVFAKVVSGFDAITNMTHADFGKAFNGPDDYFPRVPIVIGHAVRA